MGAKRIFFKADLARKQLEELKEPDHGLIHAEEGDHWDYLKAAAVLTNFYPPRVKAISGSSDVNHALEHLLPVSKPILGASGKRQWKLLPSVRKRALQKLGNSKAILGAINANSNRPSDHAQIAFEKLVNNKKPSNNASYGELAGFLEASDWLEGITGIELPDRSMLQKNLVRAKLLEPMEKLTLGFVGRKDELRSLRIYVDELASEGMGESIYRNVKRASGYFLDRPPLLVFGPGGIGKSTILAKFILQHVKNKDESLTPLTFVILDFDSPEISVDNPGSLIAAATLQIGAQFPDKMNVARHIANDILAMSAPTRDSDQSLSPSNRSKIVDTFASFVNKYVSRENPILFAVDTFEEVQYLGEDAVMVVLDLLRDLKKSIPRLRPVISGRAPIKELKVEALEIGRLDRYSAESYIRRLSKETKNVFSGKDIETITEIADGNPLTLRLAMRIVQEEGRAALEKNSSRYSFFKLFRSETVQARLYNRVLEHIHDERLAKLANPGLLLRRITPEIIRHVLAKPCGLELVEGEEDELFKLLKKEVALVRPSDEDNSLRHRTDVRRIVLADIQASDPQKAEAIDNLAKKFYSDKDDLISRAEEIYHRLRLEQAENTINSRWEKGVEPYLQSALEEIPKSRRIFLAKKLGVTPDSEILREATLAEWEEITARKVNRYLKNANINRAIDALEQREERTKLSPLYHLEFQVWRMVGQHDRARDVVKSAINGAIRVGSDEVMSRSLMSLSTLDEAEGSFKAALKHAEEAVKFASNPDDLVPKYRARIAVVRLLRKNKKYKLASKYAEELSKDLPVKMLHEFRKYPVLLRELIAELGAIDEQYLKYGSKYFRLDETDPRQIKAVENALKELENSEYSETLDKVFKALKSKSKRYDDKGEMSVWLKKNPNSQNVFRTMLTSGIGVVGSKIIAKILQASVDSAIEGGAVESKWKSYFK